MARCVIYRRRPATVRGNAIVSHYDERVLNALNEDDGTLKKMNVRVNQEGRGLRN
jgi:hypothetical protein